MIVLQAINKILQTNSIDLIQNNCLSEEYFSGYENEFEFIISHYKQYGKIPDKATFVGKFPDFDFIEVGESDQYLVDSLNEERLYYKAVPVVQKVADLLKINAQDAVEYMLAQVPLLSTNTKIGGCDIIKDANERYQSHLERINATKPWYITTGFEELDDIINGWAKGEEFVVIFARTGQGKSWVLIKTLSHAWQIGNRIGYISPEMGPQKIGYRFDTLISNFSNRNLVWGKAEPNYDQHIEQLKTNEVPFIVATPKDFAKKITVSKLKLFIQSNNLDILGIDGITYLTDERHQKGDTKTTSLTNISEDLISLSLELSVPIIVAAQSNRSGAKKEDEDGTPDLETIRDSDGIAQNATKVLSLRQTGAGLEFGIKKHRDGTTGDKLIYYWDIDKGIFKYIPTMTDSARPEKRKEKMTEIKKSFGSGSDVF